MDNILHYMKNKIVVRHLRQNTIIVIVISYSLLYRKASLKWNLRRHVMNSKKSNLFLIQLKNSKLLRKPQKKLN